MSVAQDFQAACGPNTGCRFDGQEGNLRNRAKQTCVRYHRPTDRRRAVVLGMPRVSLACAPCTVVGAKLRRTKKRKHQQLAPSEQQRVCSRNESQATKAATNYLALPARAPHTPTSNLPMVVTPEMPYPLARSLFGVRFSDDLVVHAGSVILRERLHLTGGND